LFFELAGLKALLKKNYEDYKKVLKREVKV
jgi:hypothetical protein